MKAKSLTAPMIAERLDALNNGPRIRDRHVHVALTDLEHADVLAAANRIGLGITQFVRVAALEKVRG